ncbi:LEM domain-containing protein 1 [Ctenodactylus gundi]
MVNVQCLSDCELQNQLEKLGFSPGPILPTTRKVYEKKLVQLLVPSPCASPTLNRPRKLAGPQDSDDSTENRCPSREQNSRTPCKNVPKEDPCKVNPSIWGEFPVCLRFAVLGILLIVLFVYITVEKKPLFG